MRTGETEKKAAQAIPACRVCILVQERNGQGAKKLLKSTTIILFLLRIITTVPPIGKMSAAHKHNIYQIYEQHGNMLFNTETITLHLNSRILPLTAGAESSG